jgi:hypothetical protein
MNTSLIAVLQTTMSLLPTFQTPLSARQKQEPQNSFNQQNKLTRELTLTYRGRANDFRAKLSIKQYQKILAPNFAG